MAIARRRRWVVVIVAALVVGCGSAPSSPAPSAAGSASASVSSSPGSGPTGPNRPSEHLGTLRIGDRVDGLAAFLAGPAGTFASTVDVDEPGGRLRVSLDLSNRDDCVSLALVRPDGAAAAPTDLDYPFVCPSSGRSGQTFDIEHAVDDAAVGRWGVTVDATDVRDLALRLRATLEMAPMAAGDAPLLPDLIPWLPWEFGFAAPASDDPGTAHDRDNQPGDPTVSCHPEEEPEATQCLRFSAGIHNVGAGPMYIAFRDDIAYQHIYAGDATPLDHRDNERDGRFTESEAGTGEWHPFHEHRHLSAFVLYELFAVADDAGTLSAISTGNKHGYCTFSQQIADWATTAQDPQYASFPDGPFCDAAMTLERGWGDIYRWQRPGQYVDYAAVAEGDGSMRAGRYVLRFGVDPDGHIAETDETNNTGYALVEVIDGGGPGLDRVVVCEQGLGSDPWDPAAEPVPDRFAWAAIAADPAHVPPICG